MDASTDERTVAVENGLTLARINADFYLPLRKIIVVPELCAGLIALADEVHRLRKVREDQAAQIRSLQSTVEMHQETLERTGNASPLDYP